MAEQQARELTRVGSYEILGKLGEGKMTVVYQARDVRDGKTVALKIMRPEWTQSVAFLKRFEREADAAESFDHPYLAKAYEHGEAEGYHFCALELIEGEPLSDKLKRGETLTEAQALYVTRCIAEGLQYAWTRGIIHRDIKPGNIMIQTDSRIRLIDMGLAKSF
ncbi:MAG: serine/threonine-protein kinase, partial [Planctomycetota bacterium]|nr:serine/threonine-protein kinase [Planctomycetota bacterium]